MTEIHEFSDDQCLFTGDTFLLAADLVAVPSVSFNETRITDLIEESLHDNGGHLDVFRIGDNLVARTDLGRQWRLILAGHTDTVPPSSNAQARIEGDVLWGVGSADMKGGLAVMLELALNSRRPIVDITYVFYAREEVDSVHSGLREVAEIRPDLLAADVALLLEPTGGIVEAGCQGTMRVEVSGYVLSREGAATLLRAMPVIGPVDLWMNYRFAELGALALNSPAIEQRHDEASDNAYSVLPYLARAGVVDAAHGIKPPATTHAGPVLAWTAGGEREGLAMALSMLGLRVRVYNGDEEPLHETTLQEVVRTFDALIDAPVVPTVLSAAAANERYVILMEADAPIPPGLERERLPPSRTAILTLNGSEYPSWEVLCRVLRLSTPTEAFPAGAPRAFGLFRDARPTTRPGPAERIRANTGSMDESPWVLPPSSSWQPAPNGNRPHNAASAIVAQASMTEASTLFPGITETFPGNLASFVPDGLRHGTEGARLEIDALESGVRPYRSGAIASVRSFGHGRFEAEIRAAPGSGLITGFFLHRAAPRQEIDIEFAGADPWRMLVNVYFNPGDDGTNMSFGYRGSPCRIDLGFDATAAFHRYAIDWRPGRLTWLVDGRVVHQRVGWDPTPIPHLNMRLHANLWAPRSAELAGPIDESALPASAFVKNLSVRA